MPKSKKVKKAEAKKTETAKKKVESQKKVAKALKRPAAKPKAEPVRDVKLRTEPVTPTVSREQVERVGPGGLPEEVTPQIREAYKKRFEEQQTAEIGKEASTEERRRRSEEVAMLPTTDPKAVKSVRGETTIPEAERPLTPKPTPLAEPTPGQQAKRQAGRLPRGVGRTGTFTFQEASREEDTASVKNVRDVARQVQKGRSPSPLAPHVQGTALALARRDHERAKATGKMVNEIHPDAVAPDEFSIRGTHHERLAEVIHGYGVKEEDFAKIPGKGDVPTKVRFAWSALKEHERSKRKVPLPTFSQGATHWQNPKTGEVRPLSEGNHPEFYAHEGDTQALVRGKGEASWKALEPVREGWNVTKLRGGVNAWTFRSHPGERYRGTHQVRSLFEHVSNTLKGAFPELTGVSDSADSRRRAAERVREKFIVMKPEPSEAPMFSKRATKDSGFLRERGKTKRTMVAGDNVEIKETPETEFVTGPKRIEPRRPKVVQEESGRRVVRPRRRDAGKKVGFVSQPLSVSTQMKKGLDWASLRPEAESTTKLGPSGEILKSPPIVSKEVVPDPKAVQKNPKTKKTKTIYSVKPGPVDQPLPGMESYGYEEAATAPSKVWLGRAQGKGRWLDIPAEPAKPGSARPTTQPASAGETGIEQLKYLKKQYGGVFPSSSRELVKAPKKQKVSKPKAQQQTILSGTDVAATRNIPQQLELPGIESPGYAGAMGQQFRRVSPATRELQLKSQQGAVPGVAADMPRGTEPKKSTRSFKGRR